MFGRKSSKGRDVRSLPRQLLCDNISTHAATKGLQDLPSTLAARVKRSPDSPTEIFNYVSLVHRLQISLRTFRTNFSIRNSLIGLDSLVFPSAIVEEILGKGDEMVLLDVLIENLCGVWAAGISV